MVNSQLVRVCQTQKMIQNGFLAKIYCDSSNKNTQIWDHITSSFESYMNKSHSGRSSQESPESEDSSSSQPSVCHLLHSDTNRSQFQLPRTKTFDSLHSVMSLCEKFCEQQQKENGVKTDYFVTLMNLEQVFIACAAKQITPEE